MFTGIIESVGTVTAVETVGSNQIFWIESSISNNLKIDQSVSHSGVCLTVDALQPGQHRVTAIAETLSKTNLGTWQPGTNVNLERCLQMNGRLDGHVVQGHVDTTATCINRSNKNGSWEYRFEIPIQFASLIIEKGSICLNGISLTIFDLTETQFSVAIIPYTFENTNIKEIAADAHVNIEFDIFGKYLNRLKSLNQ